MPLQACSSASSTRTNLALARSQMKMCPESEPEQM